MFTKGNGSTRSEEDSWSPANADRLLPVCRHLTSGVRPAEIWLDATRRCRGQGALESQSNSRR